MFSPRCSRKVFTLLELHVVIAIFALLAAILFPVFAQARESARALSYTIFGGVGLASLMPFFAPANAIRRKKKARDEPPRLPDVNLGILYSVETDDKGATPDMICGCEEATPASEAMQTERKRLELSRKSQKINDDRLVVRAIGGDRLAMEALIRQNRETVRRIAKGASYDDCEDIAQEVSIAFARYLKEHKDEPIENVHAWILRVSNFKAIDSYRRKKFEKSLDYEVEEKQFDLPDLLSASPVDVAHVNNLLQRLPQHTRTAIILVYLEEYSYDEAAQIQGISITQLRSYLNSGKRDLRRWWDNACSNSSAQV